ncbi:hypothetical protein DPMN_179083 [Dreissena polymorpha]|uniref:Uncharacterized protein n=1 Tax=Dreissena polymorpha TaxID=45954 RepID=A0A9D4IKG2_DREPO|nr:hypothetical protein DPMN_179083 [Dreissena polymorpha]
MQPYRLKDRRTECDCYMPPFTDCQTEGQSVTAICHPLQSDGQKDRSVTAICHPIQTDRQKDRECD